MTIRDEIKAVVQDCSNPANLIDRISGLVHRKMLEVVGQKGDGLIIKGFPRDILFHADKEIQDHLKDGGTVLIRANGDGTTMVITKVEF